MHILVDAGGEVKVDHGLYAENVKPARGDIGREEVVRGARLEVLRKEERGEDVRSASQSINQSAIYLSIHPSIHPLPHLERL